GPRGARRAGAPGRQAGAARPAGGGAAGAARPHQPAHTGTAVGRASPGSDRGRTRAGAVGGPRATAHPTCPAGGSPGRRPDFDGGGHGDEPGAHAAVVGGGGGAARSARPAEVSAALTGTFPDGGQSREAYKQSRQTPARRLVVALRTDSDRATDVLGDELGP